MISVLLVIFSWMACVSAFAMLYKTKRAQLKQQEELEALRKTTEDSLKISTELFRFYSTLQDNQNLQIKAFEAMSKNQKLTSSDLLELRDQVSKALVAIVEQISGVSSGELLPAKDDDGKAMN